MRIDWDDGYLVKVEIFDYHHQHLFELLSDLASAIEGDGDIEKKEEILDSLSDYALIHLDAEEMAMETHGYPDIEAHKKEHAVMREKIEEFHKSHKAGESIATLSLLEFVSGWWKTHIATTDKKYSAFFQDKGIK